MVVGQHPRDLALSPDGKRLYTLNLVSDDISVVDTDTLTVVATFHLADDLRPVIIQEGERIWLTSRPEEISRDNWMACASCHFDTGFDGQTWLGTTGGPRNTPIVRGIQDTEPLHWSAPRGCTGLPGILHRPYGRHWTLRAGVGRTGGVPGQPGTDTQPSPRS